MTTNTLTQDRVQSTAFLPIIAAIGLAFGMLYFAGFAEASVFHDAAHDTRHTLAFPCH